jgi:hypothetical protein
MLTDNQTKYIQTIPKEKTVTIKPYSQSLRNIADIIINEIGKITPNIETCLMGAVGLGISGQGDLDIYMLLPASDFRNYIDKLINFFGKPLHQHTDSVEWCFIRDGVEVELYLTDPHSESMQEQLEVFNILKKDMNLRAEYEKLKSDYDGRSFRDYQRAKYEFYNRLLDK